MMKRLYNSYKNTIKKRSKLLKRSRRISNYIKEEMSTHYMDTGGYPDTFDITNIDNTPWEEIKKSHDVAEWRLFQFNYRKCPQCNKKVRGVIENGKIICPYCENIFLDPRK